MEHNSTVLAKHRKDVRDYILRNNLIPYQCSECGCDGNWRGKQLSLHLHHINGINDDNRLENLTFLCPNCHAATKIEGVIHGQHAENPNIYKCKICGKRVTKTSEYCVKCAHDLQKKVEFNREQLKKEIRSNSWRELSRKYGISDTAIKKRCKTFGLPFTTKEIKSYSDEEWDLI